MTAILIIAALVALVWGTLFLLRGSLLMGGLAYVIAAAVFGHPFLHFELGSIPLTLDRLILPILVAAYVIQTRLGRTDPKPIARTEIVMWLFLALLATSGTVVSWEGIPGEPWSNVFRLWSGYLAPMLVYWIVRQSALDRRQLSVLYATLVILGVYLGLTGLLEVSKQWWGVFPAFIADPKLGIHFGRARGPMIHAVSYGLYVGICLLAAGLYRWRFGRFGRLALLLLLPLMLGGLICSFTRSVWMGFGLALAVVAAVALRGRWRIGVLGGMATAALLMGAMQFEALKAFQREDSAADSRKSVEMRGAFTYVSWQMFRDRPLLGFGFGQFYSAKLPYLSDRNTDLVLEDIRDYVHHNTFLSLLTETGLLGLSMYLVVLGGWARAAWQLARHCQAPDWARAQGILMLGALAIYCVQGLFHELTYTPIDHGLIFLLAGVTMGLHARLVQSAAEPNASAIAGWPEPRSIAAGNPVR
jgi:O-antigen ligase